MLMQRMWWKLEAELEATEEITDSNIVYAALEAFVAASHAASSFLKRDFDDE